MGMWNFIVDMSQEGRLYELEDRVKKLEEQNEILYEWVQYFKHILEVPPNDQS